MDGDCTVLFDLERIYRNMEDSTSLATVGTKALAIIRQCVVTGRGGGFTIIGDRGRMKVGVIGRLTQEYQRKAAMPGVVNALQMETACASNLF